MAEATLFLSLLLQLASALFALRLIRVTGRSLAWGCLAAALLLMVLRRSITLYQALAGIRPPELQAELVALAISVLMLVGVAAIGRVVRLVSQADEVARLVREVARGEAVFRGVIDQTFQFISLMTIEGTLIEVNRSALVAVGTQADEVVGRPYWETVWWQHSRGLQDRLRRAIAQAAGGQLDRFEATHVAADGSLIYVDCSIKPLFGQQGDVLYLIAEARDVTALKADQARLEQLNEKLEQMNKKLDEFAYIASHDLKSPLRAIEHLATWVEQDAEGRLPSKAADHLRRIRQRIGRMDVLLDELLAYSRAGEDKQVVEEVDLETLIQEIVALVRRPEAFTVELADDLPTIWTEKPPLATCLRNIVDNAMKHHDRTDGRVCITVEAAEDYVDIAVADDGPGIDPRYHERIFKVFQTLAPAGNTESTGVGLAHVRKIVDQAGGDVWVESQVGQGARFTLRWPRSRPPLAPSDAATDNPTDAATLPRPPQNEAS